MLIIYFVLIKLNVMFLGFINKYFADIFTPVHQLLLLVQIPMKRLILQLVIRKCIRKQKLKLQEIVLKQAYVLSLGGFMCYQETLQQGTFVPEEDSCLGRFLQEEDLAWDVL